MRNRSRVASGLPGAGRRRLPVRRALAATAVTAAGVVALGAGASPAAADACPNAQYRTGPSAGLADCRAYEQVSPIDKSGGDVTPDALAATLRYGSGLTATSTRGPVPLQIWQAATGGDAVAYSSRAAFAGSLGSLGLNPYIARRGATDWTTQSLTPPMNASPLNPSYYVNKMQYQQYAPDLSRGVLLDIDPAGPLLADGAIAGYANLYLRDNANGRFNTVSTVAPPNTPPTGAGLTYSPQFQGASSDYSHVIFVAPDALTANAQGPCTNCTQLYERTNGAIRSVNVLPGGSTTTPNAALGATWAMARDQNQSQTQGAVSDDGTKIYWSALQGSTSAAPDDIYVRVNGRHTVPVGSGTFWAGSPDGRQAIYLSGSYGRPGDLYKFTLDAQTSPPTGSSVNLTPNANGQVLGVVGTSADLSYVYFVATAALAPGAVAGAPNLYLYHEGDGVPIRLIATLPAGEADGGNSNVSINSPVANNRISYVTPDGRHLAFASAGALTGYATTPSHPRGCVDTFGSNTADCNEVFAYDADTSTLTCASCKAAGTSPDGPSMVVPAQNQSHRPHVMSDDGSRLFFQSWDKLVPEDTNGQQDVYEWVPNGAHGCAKATGCVSLISGGTGGTADPGVTNAPLNAFVDASPDGKNVFFTTVQSLVPDDVDGTSDLYVARVDGGLAGQHQPPAPAPCVGDRCRPDASTAAPLLAAPGSVAYVAPFAPAPRAPAESSAGKVSVRRPKTVRGKTKVRLSVKAPGKGRIRVSGSGLRRAKKTAKKSKTYRVTVKLSNRSQRILKRKHRVTVRATVQFSPEHGKASRARVHVTFKTKQHHGKTSRRSRDRAHRLAGKGGR